MAGPRAVPGVPASRRGNLGVNLDGFLFTGEWTSGYRAEIRARVAGDFVGWETDNLKFETRTGSLTVTDNAAGSPHSAALNGTGVPISLPRLGNQLPQRNCPDEPHLGERSAAAPMPTPTPAPTNAPNSALRPR